MMIRKLGFILALTLTMISFGSREQALATEEPGYDDNSQLTPEQTELERSIKFWKSVTDGDETIVKRFLDEGTDPNFEEYGHSALEEAASFGQLEIMKLLIIRGAEINRQSEHFGTTPLIGAAATGNSNAVRYLLEQGAKVELEDSDGSTALISAAYNGNVEVIELLLNAGADIKHVSNDGTTALAAAAKSGNAEAAALLLEKGADPAARTETGASPLILAAQNGSDSTVRTLLRSGADVNAKDTDGFTALIHAARGGHANVAILLLNGGADVNAIDSQGRTPLLWTAYNNQIEVARVLIQKGADVNVKDGFGRSALTQAQRLGYSELSDVLLRAGAKDSEPAGMSNEILQIQPEEYAVYAAVIDDVYLPHDGTPGIQEKAELVVISEYTCPTSEVSDCAKYLSAEQSEDILKDFQTKNEEKHKLQNSFAYKLKCVIITGKEQYDIFEHGEWWDEFYKKYPASHGILSLSRVGFNQQKDLALVYAGNQREGLSGAGYCIVLKKQDGHWVIQKKQITYIS